MGKYLNKVYEWQPVNPTDPSILVRDPQLVRQLAGGAGTIQPSLLGPSGLFGGVSDTLAPATGLLNALLGDPNARTPNRDSTTGFFPIPLIAEGGARKSIREHIKDTVAQGYPLTIKTNTFVTKVVFDESGPEPQAVGVEYLEGGHLYRASPMSGGTGTSGSVNATKEVILAGVSTVPSVSSMTWNIRSHLIGHFQHGADAKAQRYRPQERARVLQDPCQGRTSWRWYQHARSVRDWS